MPNRIALYARLLARTWRNARRISRERGYGVGTQVRDILRLRQVGVGPDDYYLYDLCDPERFPDFAAKLTYRGYRYKQQLRRFSPVQIQGLTFHKHIFYRLAADFGLPVPRLHGVYAPTPDCFGRHEAMTRLDELERFLSGCPDYPLFGKLSNSSHGYGAIGMRGRGPDATVELVTGEHVGVPRLAAEIDRYSHVAGTYLFCEGLEPRDDFRRMCGSTLHSVRLVVLVRDGEPEPYHASVLLPLDRQHFSNARCLTTGSCSGAIDLATGRIHRVINSPGPLIHAQPCHPETGEHLEGYVIPGWLEMVGTVLTAARAFSPLRMQHWDAAFTTRGPVLLELNFIGDVEPMQMHGPPGLYTEQFRTFERTQRVW